MNNHFESLGQKQKESIRDNLPMQLELARKLESVYEHRPDIRNFEGAMKGTKQESEYTKEAIQKDVEYVDSTRAKIEEKNSSQGKEVLDSTEIGFQLSEILQAMIVDRLNNHWFKNFQAIMTSDYDDLRSGIDAVFKHETGVQLGASFDFTVATQEKIIYKKLKDEWEKHVVKGSVPVLKYYEDPDTHEKKSLLVPRFIIGATVADVEELAHAYINNDSAILDNHPFKYLMLQQIEEQLQSVLDEYELNPDPKYDFAKKKYEAIQKLLRIMKNDIHLDEETSISVHEYSKKSVALDMMRRFRIMRQSISGALPDEAE